MSPAQPAWKCAGEGWRRGREGEVMRPHAKDEKKNFASLTKPVIHILIRYYLSLLKTNRV